VRDPAGQAQSKTRAWRAPAVAGVVWLIALLARLALPQSGLQGEYFPNPAWAGPPAHAQVDPEISTPQLSRGWGYSPPDAFSVRWSGFLNISRSGDYTFHLAADDGATLSIDREIAAVGGDGRGALPGGGRRHLTAGAHPVSIDYAQTGGAYLLDWTWALGGVRAEPVPGWRLSPRPASVPLLAVRHAASISWPFLAIALLVLVVRAAMETGCWPAAGAVADRDGGATSSLPWKALVGWRAVAALVFFVALSIAHTWPLASAPSTLSRNDNADTVLNEWTLAWVVHQASIDPSQLFDAPIFHPERRTLAYSEALILQSAFAAPLFAFGASPVLAYNIVLLAGMALTGWTMCLVLARWTGNWAAGLVAGIALAFNAHTLTRIPHLQAQHAEFFPVALLALDAVLRSPRWSRALFLALAVVGQALASVYLLVFTVVALAVAFVSRPEDWMKRRGIRVVAHLLLAALAAGAVLTPLLLPYWRLRGAGFVRSLDEAAWFSASVRDYVTTPARWYPWAGGGLALFPGTVAIGLAVVAILAGVALRDVRPRMCLAFASVGVLFSFGPAVVPGYEALYGALPLLQGIRMTSRFGYLGIVGIAVLAGYGVAVLSRAVPSLGPTRKVLAGTLVLLAALEPLAAPIAYEPFLGINAIYTRMRSEPSAVVVELPYPNEDRIYANASYLLNSTAHWRPMLNGYSGFVPRSYVARVPALDSFPSEAAVAALQRSGVTHVFVHLDAFGPDIRGTLDGWHGLHELAVEDGVALYSLDGRSGP
jgi:hypothetical protein